MKIILASASPRRRELLAQIGMAFEVITADVEERTESAQPDKVVEELSGIKARAVLDMLLKEQTVSADGEKLSGDRHAFLQEDILIIGADTIVACDDKILGKPGSEAGACEMLRLLQGREHQVYTGVTLLYRNTGDGSVEQKQFHEETDVIFYPMKEEEIIDYVATKDPLDKAGSYGIQGLCARYISGIKGDYNNVVGLPVGRLYQEMKGYL